MGERELIGVAGLVVLFILIILRAPVGLSMIAVGIGGNYVLSLYLPYLRFEPYLKQFKTLLWQNLSSYDLSVVPLFVLMGFLATHARLSSDLFRGMEALAGRLRGGVAIAAIGACGAFGAVCGSSLATAATMGRVALPELDRLKYSPRLAMGTLAAGGTLGILIPPSVALVIYAILVEGSVIELFQAAILPGLLAILGFMLVISIYVRLRPEAAPLAEPQSKEARRKALRRMVPVSLIFGTIILGLGLGLFTPTPAASIGVFFVLVYGLARQVISGDGLSLRGTAEAIKQTAVTSGMIYFVLFGAEVLKTFFTRAGLPAAMADWAVHSAFDPWTILIVMLLILVLLGCFMESLSMILIVVPFFWPILSILNGGEYVSAADAAFHLEADELRIWFGILALVVVELGLITPPVGMNVFIIASMVKGSSVKEAFIGVLPFISAELIRVALLLGIPSLVLFFPRLLS